MIDIPDCPDCLRLMVEDLAKRAADPRNVARLDPEQAEKVTRHLRELLNRPNDGLEELAKLLAVEAKKRVGILRELKRVGPTSRLPMLHGNSILHLVRKARQRTNDPVLLAVCAVLEYEQALHAAHKTKSGL